MNEKELDKVSRKLTQILRHKIVEYKLNCDDKGFVKVSDLYKFIPKISDDDLIKIVETNSKKRFELIKKIDEFYIRAVQGHSESVGALINDLEAMEFITEPLEYCIHGTEDKYIDSIKKTGLNRMSRKHIHLVSEILENKQTSGYKNKSNVLIFIDMKKCMEDGIKFYRSNNGVILTEGINGNIPPNYFSKITKR